MSRQLMVTLLTFFWVVPLSALVYPDQSSLKASGYGDDNDVGQQGFRNDHWIPCPKPWQLPKQRCRSFFFCFFEHQVTTGCDSTQHHDIKNYQSDRPAESFEGQFPDEKFQSEDEYLAQAEEATPLAPSEGKSWIPSVPSFNKPHKKRHKEEKEEDPWGGGGGWGKGWGKGYGGWGGGKGGGWFR